MGMLKSWCLSVTLTESPLTTIGFPEGGIALKNLFTLKASGDPETALDVKEAF